MKWEKPIPGPNQGGGFRQEKSLSPEKNQRLQLYRGQKHANNEFQKPLKKSKKRKRSWH